MPLRAAHGGLRPLSQCAEKQSDTLTPTFFEHPPAAHHAHQATPHPLHLSAAAFGRGYLECASGRPDSGPRVVTLQRFECLHDLGQRRLRKPISGAGSFRSKSSVMRKAFRCCVLVCGASTGVQQGTAPVTTITSPGQISLNCRQQDTGSYGHIDGNEANAPSGACYCECLSRIPGSRRKTPLGERSSPTRRRRRSRGCGGGAVSAPLTRHLFPALLRHCEIRPSARPCVRESSSLVDDAANTAASCPSACLIMRLATCC